jgi:predicted DCC family thiol-disulfide oxidoreductase YuxK
MSNLAEKQGVWFVYDGECPMCNTAAHAFHLINARKTKDDPLIEEINKRKIDLDEGMVIYCEDRFYHGKDALKFMARWS